MDKLSLNLKKRKITGRKVKKLRNEGMLPANIYGKKMKSQAVKLDVEEFDSVYEKAGTNSVVSLRLEQNKEIPVLIKNVQIHPVTGNYLHVDFHKVDLKEKIATQIPIEVIGESPAVKEKTGTLLVILSEIEVEALPTDLPDVIEVDVSILKEVDQAIKAQDIKLSNKVVLLTDPNLELVKIAPLVSKEAEEMVKEEELAAEEAKAEEAKAEEAEAKEDEKKEPASEEEDKKEKEKSKEEKDK